MSSYLRLGLLKGLFPEGLPVKILKAPLPFSILIIWPAHLNILDLIVFAILGERYKLRSSSLWRFLLFPFLSLLVSNNRLKILFSNTLRRHSSLNANDHISQPFITTGIIIIIQDSKANIMRDENGDRWRLHNEELHSLYRSANILKGIKSGRLRWAVHVARIEEGRSSFQI